MNPLLTGLLPIVGDVIKKVVPDKAGQEKAMAELESKLADNEQALLLAQADINKLDAKSGKFWQAGWRPAIGWVCAVGFAVMVIIAPLVKIIGKVFNPEFPDLDLPPELMYSVMGSMLGIGGIRSYDKTKGNHLK